MAFVKARIVALGLAAFLVGGSAAPPAQAGLDQQWSQFRTSETRRQQLEVRHRHQKAKSFVKRQHRKAKAYVKRQRQAEPAR
jgi:hypothetical protein